MGAELILRIGIGMFLVGVLPDSWRTLRKFRSHSVGHDSLLGSGMSILVAIVFLIDPPAVGTLLAWAVFVFGFLVLGAGYRQMVRRATNRSGHGAA